MTQQEAIDTIDSVIFSKPAGVPDDQIQINLTKEIADHLVDYWNSKMPESKFLLYRKAGDIFYWRGIECKVI